MPLMEIGPARNGASAGVIPHQSISDDFDYPVIRVPVIHTKIHTGELLADSGKDVIARTRLSRVIRVIYGNDANPGKLRFLFSPLQTQPVTQGGSIYRYVHSKVFIMDDAFCTIGSMNFNRRSTTHDSELSLGFYEPNPKANTFAKQLRLRLWQHHLGLTTTQLYLVEDPLEGIANVWRKIGFHIGKPDGTPLNTPWKPNVVGYNWAAENPLGTAESSWYDPLGAGITNETEFVDKITDPVVTSDETARLPRR
jgi:hypothetical protein